MIRLGLCFSLCGFIKDRWVFKKEFAKSVFLPSICSGELLNKPRQKAFAWGVVPKFVGRYLRTLAPEAIYLSYRGMAFVSSLRTLYT